MLVDLKLLLKCGHLIDELSLVIFKGLDDLALSTFLLLECKFEILALSFKNLGQLLLLKSELLTLSLQDLILFGKLGSLI